MAQRHDPSIGSIITCTFPPLDGILFLVAAHASRGGYILQALTEEDGERVLFCPGAVGRARRDGIVTFCCSGSYIKNTMGIGPVEYMEIDRPGTE